MGDNKVKLLRFIQPNRSQLLGKGPIMTSSQKNMRGQAGFTLVELAIVMIIIGLLIAGVLKGQQLITNAQVAATVAQVKAFDAATTSFRDMYAATPGDLTTAQSLARLPNCLAGTVCNANNGDGDGKVDAVGVAIRFNAAPAVEQIGYWAQLNAVGLVTSISPSTVAALAQVWGGDYPASKLAGGGFDIGWNSGLAAVSLNGLASTIANATQAGEYLALHGTAFAAVGAAATDTFLKPNYAMRLDTKLDDGNPNTGDVLAAENGAASVTNCVNSGAAGGVYNELLPNAVCDLYIKFQN
jgi:prepilin-type N-terminal cleavage/methylation domain-containing protein